MIHRWIVIVAGVLMIVSLVIVAVIAFIWWTIEGIVDETAIRHDLRVFNDTSEPLIIRRLDFHQSSPVVVKPNRSVRSREDDRLLGSTVHSEFVVIDVSDMNDRPLGRFMLKTDVLLTQDIMDVTPLLCLSIASKPPREVFREELEHRKPCSRLLPR